MTYKIQIATAGFIRPDDDTQYAAGDLVANDTTAADVVPLVFSVGEGGIRIKSARLIKSDNTITDAEFSLRLFGVEPTSAAGDNEAFSTDFAEQFGVIEFPLMEAATDCGQTFAHDLDINWSSRSGLIYGLIEVVDTYTPTEEEEFTATLIFESIY